MMVGFLMVLLYVAFLVAIVSAIIAVFQIRTTVNYTADKVAEVSRRLDELQK